MKQTIENTGHAAHASFAQLSRGVTFYLIKHSLNLTYFEKVFKGLHDLRSPLMVKALSYADV